MPLTMIQLWRYARTYAESAGSSHYYYLNNESERRKRVYRKRLLALAVRDKTQGWHLLALNPEACVTVKMSKPLRQSDTRLSQIRDGLVFPSTCRQLSS